MVFGIALLEFDQLLAAGVHPRLVVLRPAVTLDIRLLQIGDGEVFPLRVGQEVAVSLDQDAELRTPVTQMIVRDHAVSEGAVDPVQRVSDDGRTDVSDVHLLRRVGAGVVDDDGLLRAGVRDTEAGGRGKFAELLREPDGIDGEIDEPRAGHFDFRERVRQRERVDDRLGDRARRFVQLFRELHGVIALEVAEPGVGRGLDPRGNRLGIRAESGDQRLLEPFGDPVLAHVYRVFHKVSVG